jgi:hypothetical protein
MKPDAKLHLKSALYCALLVGLNWSYSTEYSRTPGVTRVELSPAWLALVLSVATAGYLAYRCVQAARLRLESGKAVAKGEWIQNGAVLIYVLPLLFGKRWTSSWTEPDGTLVAAQRGFGHACSAWILIFAVIGLLAYQVLSRLSEGSEVPNQAPPRPAASGASAAASPVAPPPRAAGL